MTDHYELLRYASFEKIYGELAVALMRRYGKDGDRRFIDATCIDPKEIVNRPGEKCSSVEKMLLDEIWAAHNLYRRAKARLVDALTIIEHMNSEGANGEQAKS